MPIPLLSSRVHGGRLRSDEPGVHTPISEAGVRARAEGSSVGDETRREIRQPEALLGPLGVDIHKPEFWQKGFDEIRGLVKRMEMLVSRTER